MHIEPQQVHLWHSIFSAKTPLHHELTLLDETERARTERFRFAIHRDRYIHAHAFLRNVLALYLPVAAKDIVFNTAKQRKPSIALPQTTLQFNLSHSEDMTVCAIHAHSPLGIDIEKIQVKKNHGALAKRFFTEKEYQALMQSDIKTHNAEFYFIWTAKEAIIKAAGLGIAKNWQEFTVALSRPHQEINFANQTWQLIMHRYHTEFQLAIACHPNVRELVHYEFDQKAPILTRTEFIKEGE